MAYTRNVQNAQGEILSISSVNNITTSIDEISNLLGLEELTISPLELIGTHEACMMSSIIDNTNTIVGMITYTIRDVVCLSIKVGNYIILDENSAIAEELYRCSREVRNAYEVLTVDGVLIYTEIEDLVVKSSDVKMVFKDYLAYSN